MSANQQMARGKFTMNRDRNDRIDAMTATNSTIDPARRVLVIF
jgi:hypothetical protein